jgi:hypothetical protein
VHSPELGSSSSKLAVPPEAEAKDSTSSPDLEECDDSDVNDVQLKKKQGHRRDELEWQLVARYERRDHSQTTNQKILNIL